VTSSSGGQIVGWLARLSGCKFRGGAHADVFNIYACSWKISRLHADYDARSELLTETVQTMKLDKIYTRTGDEGKTSLGDGSRLPKFHLRVTAYGSIDEANSVIGVANLHVENPEVFQLLRHIQNDLFDVGADLCRPERPGAEKPLLRITGEQVTWLENQIDRLNAELAPLDSFVLPGGSPASSYLHHARTVTRRAERDVVRLSTDEPVNPAVLQYVNRLSDFLFVLARFLNGKGKEDVRWQPGLYR
jgi:cob(I)alamin adenosyltransferase